MSVARTGLAAGGVLSLAEAHRRLAGVRDVRYVELFRHGTLTLELYAPRGTDPQQPHTRDEVYVVASGHGEFVVEGRRQAFKTGDCLFVPAKVPHRFEQFSDDFAVWVMFYGPEGGESP